MPTAPPRPRRPTAPRGGNQRRAKREWANRARARDQDIGEIPDVADPKRRKAGLACFETFCRTYGAAEFCLPWAPCHKKAAAKIQRAVDRGGWFAFAEPRGSGKTTRATWAAIWATLRGSWPYTVIIAATDPLAQQLLAGVKTILSTNDTLRDDFPAALWPLWKLEGEPRRCSGQSYRGKRTAPEWGKDRVVLPWIDREDSLSPNAVISAHGLTGALRGMKHVRRDGSSVRPAGAIVDDPQTRGSARSFSQTQTRLETLTGDVAYLAGPGKPISIFCPCTVIYTDDLAERLLDNERFPQWQGERVAMVESFPTNVKLWDEYEEHLRASWRAYGDARLATAFYKKHRKKLDRGGKVYWPERFEPDELSGLQHAMNLRIRGPEAFQAEAQNQPLELERDLETLTADEIARKQSGFNRGEFPPTCRTLTAFVDVQGSLLYWLVAAWQDDFTGYVIDYGTWPDQNRRAFSLAGARHTLRNRYPGASDNAALFAGLADLFARLLSADWTRDDGATLRVARCLVDANWGQTSELVNSAARQSPHAAVITPSYGRGIKATHKPVSLWQQSRNVRCGPEWTPTKPKGRMLPGVIYDANYWKRRTHDALALPMGSPGALALYKAGPTHHAMIADHLAAEVPKRSEHDGRVVFEWHKKPGAEEHLADCTVGAMVAASVAGVADAAHAAPAPPARARGRTNRRRVRYH